MLPNHTEMREGGAEAAAKVDSFWACYNKTHAVFIFCFIFKISAQEKTKE